MTNSMDLMTDLQMAGQSKEEQAKKALRHLLHQIQYHHAIGYFLGPGTQTFSLVTEAVATLFNLPVEAVRTNFKPRHPRNPYEETSVNPAQKIEWIDRPTQAGWWYFYNESYTIPWVVWIKGEPGQFKVIYECDEVSFEEFIEYYGKPLLPASGKWAGPIPQPPLFKHPAPKEWDPFEESTPTENDDIPD